MKRREWLKSTAGLIALGAADPSVVKAAETEDNKEEPQRAQLQRTQRRRRLIFNDDAGYVGGYRLDADGPEKFLERRFGQCADTQVDSYFWCVLGPGDGLQYPNEDREVWQLIIDSSRKKGMEVFGSLRMNDTHDAVGKISDPFKIAHPECLLGELEGLSFGSIMRQIWSGLNYAMPQVHEYLWGTIRTVCTQYDYDGFELDFSRHPLFFKFGEEEENLAVMTEFVSRVRQMLDEIGRRRGRPFLLSAHLPETPALSRKLGLDMEAWLEKGLIDLLVIGWGYNPYTAAIEESVELGHRHNIPVYANINCSMIADGAGNYAQRLRGMASNLLSKGADGLYLFNMFVSIDLDRAKAQEVYATLNELGSLETLSRKDKVFLYGPLVTWPFQLYSSTTSPLFPISLVDGGPLELFVGDELEEEARKGTLKELRLMARVTGIAEGEGVRLLVNGIPVEESARKKAEEPLLPRSPHPAMTNPPGAEKDDLGIIFEFVAGAPPFTAGANQLEFMPGKNCVGSWTSRIQDIRLDVEYS